MRRAALTIAIALLAVVALAAPAGAADADHDGRPNRSDRCPSIPGTRADGCPTAKWRLRDTPDAGTADWAFPFGSLGWRPVAGDWGLDDSVGAFNPATGNWVLRVTPCQCSETFTVHFDVTAPGPHIPIAGNWDGTGVDGIGIYTPATSTFHLRNDLTSGGPDVVFAFGGAQPAKFVRPVAGDWDGDGDDTVGLFRKDTNRWRLRNSNDAGPADLLFTYGQPGSAEQAVEGDWDGNATDTVGYFVAGTGQWSLRNSNSAGAPDLQFAFGGGQRATAVAGDWDVDLDADDSVGVQRR
jgi:hypothetical protein